MQCKIGFRYHERILQAVMNVVMIHLVNDGGHFSWIFMILWLVCSAKLMSCRVFWSTVRSFFKTENLARPFAGQHAHYYYLKGLLFCFWLILQPPGDRNHDVRLLSSTQELHTHSPRWAYTQLLINDYCVLPCSIIRLTNLIQIKLRQINKIV